mmetsp:Transcript_31914/g.23601  ORF Transcript_31914/g.23601 Transcript_31914/m.23601 type:complete len:91 (-) Transcript_31914:39-311(-)
MNEETEEMLQLPEERANAEGKSMYITEEAGMSCSGRIVNLNVVVDWTSEVVTAVTVKVSTVPVVKPERVIVRVEAAILYSVVPSFMEYSS